MGCPIDLVCDKGMGAALMGRTRKLRGIIAVSVSVFQPLLACIYALEKHSV